MRVATGKVRAMVNLRKNDKGTFVDAYNYALKDASEPGSTFKVVSLLAAMDDGFIIDENTKVDTEGKVGFMLDKELQIVMEEGCMISVMS